MCDSSNDSKLIAICSKGIRCVSIVSVCVLVFIFSYCCMKVYFFIPVYILGGYRRNLIPVS